MFPTNIKNISQKWESQTNVPSCPVKSTNLFQVNIKRTYILVNFNIYNTGNLRRQDVFEGRPRPLKASLKGPPKGVGGSPHYGKEVKNILKRFYVLENESNFQEFQHVQAQ